MSINLCQFMGNLGADPELKTLPDGRAVVNFSLACGEKWKDKTTGEIKEKTEWIRVVMFGKRAEVVNEHFKKGSQIYVTGKMRTRDYEKDGVKHWATEIVADEFQFCGNRPAGSGGEAKAQQQAQAYEGMPEYGDSFNDDIPF